MLEVLGGDSMAGGIRLPALWIYRCVGKESPSIVSVQTVSNTDIGYCGNNLPPHPETVASVALCDVAHYEPEIRRECVGVEAGTGAWQLPNRMGMASSLAPRNGSPRARETFGDCGGG